MKTTFIPENDALEGRGIRAKRRVPVNRISVLRRTSQPPLKLGPTLQQQMKLLQRPSTDS